MEVIMAGKPRNQNEHPLYPYRNLAAAIDDRLLFFIVQSALAGKITIRPSLLLTQVSGALGGSDVETVLIRIDQHCGKGLWLHRIVRVGCSACGYPNQLNISASELCSDASIVCKKCQGALLVANCTPEEILVIGDEFLEYLEVISGRRLKIVKQSRPFSGEG